MHIRAFFPVGSAPDAIIRRVSPRSVALGQPRLGEKAVAAATALQSAYGARQSNHVSTWAAIPGRRNASAGKDPQVLLPREDGTSATASLSLAPFLEEQGQ